MNTKLQRGLLCASMVLSAPVVAEVPLPRAAPAEHCVDARAVASMRPLSDRDLLLLESNGSATRLEFDPACVGDRGFEGELQLLAPQGFVCPGAIALLRRSAAADCAVQAVQPLDTRALAAALRTAPGTPALAPIDVRGGKPQRAFSGTHAHCFAERHARSYTEDGEGLIVRVRSSRSGGNSEYRVVLEGACPDLLRWYSIGFKSGANNGVICGNPGDAVIEKLEFLPPMPVFELGGHAPPGIGEQCAIREVYPLPG